MSTKGTSVLKSITDLDLELAAGFYPVLIEYAKRVEVLSYSDLKRETVARFPALTSEVLRCTDLAVGRRLEIFRMFTNEKGYPDLSSLVVRKGTDDCGSGFEGDYEKERLRIAAHDWSTAEEFNARVRSLANTLRRKAAPKRSRDEARAIMAEQAKRSGVTKLVFSEQREQIIELIRANSDPEEAFRLVLGGVAGD